METVNYPMGQGEFSVPSQIHMVQPPAFRNHTATHLLNTQNTNPSYKANINHGISPRTTVQSV